MLKNVAKLKTLHFIIFPEKMRFLNTISAVFLERSERNVLLNGH